MFRDGGVRLGVSPALFPMPRAALNTLFIRTESTFYASLVKGGLRGYEKSQYNSTFV